MGKKNKPRRPRRQRNVVAIPQQRTNVQIRHETQSFSLEAGPLPPPDRLEKYELIVPGAAERIIRMAENQAAHRMSLESRAMNSDVVNSRIGLVFAFVIGLFGMGGGFWLIIQGKFIEGTAFSGVTVSGLVTAFIYGSRSRRKERLDNQKLLQR